MQKSFGATSTNFAEMARGMPWQTRMALPTLGGLVAGICLVLAGRRPAEGTADHMEAVTIGNVVVPIWQSIWRCISSIFTIASRGSISRAEDLNLRVGPVASGSAVLANEAIVKEILKHERTLLGIEMEIYGVYAAAAYASFPRPTAFAMKAVCDFGTKVKDDKYQTYAAYTSAQLVREFLERYLCEMRHLAGT
ncbi:hypothetical protein E2553_45445 [Paraburkholderia dipogonis]|uniref:Nucleoside phosphorylase domain-containing protein n=1 Tax=Paraburkholderia dipogonis TaxID=1211383 RepID=A0A4Y8MHG6_9BURK|nr:hypothetical protein [Paraburkholderia dipogonis]TFE36881.1 hypothetical protein E2553_45445 [Paraburkholderia dipogonis]